MNRHRRYARLSEGRIETLRPGLHADGGNLYLDHKNPPGKNWVFRFKRDGKAHDMGLGPWPLVSLAEARELALDCRKKLRAGIDPLAERQAARAAARIAKASAITFRRCTEAYFAAHEPGWKTLKHGRQWLATVETYVYPVFGNLPVAAVDTALVRRVLEPIWRKKTVTANRVRGRIEKVLDWAAAAGYRTGENPARWRGHFEYLLPHRNKVAPIKSRPRPAAVAAPPSRPAADEALLQSLAAIEAHVKVLRQQNRDLGETPRALLQGMADIKRLLGLIEAPVAPRPSRRYPLGG